MMNTGDNKANAADLLRGMKRGELYRISIHSRRSSLYGRERDTTLARFGKVHNVIDSGDNIVTVVFDQFTAIEDAPGSMVPLFNGRRFLAASYNLADEPIDLATWANATLHARVNAQTARAQRSHRAFQRRHHII